MPIGTHVEWGDVLSRVTSEPEPTPLPADSSSRAPVTTLLLVAMLVVGGLVANLVAQNTASSSEPAAVQTVEPTPEPGINNAILFLVDDMSDFSCAEARLYLPRSSEWLVDQGMCYENATTATPVCCPARAQIQTAQLPHNNRVRSQHDALRLRADRTVQADLGAAGITSYGIGKNLNGVKVAQYFGPLALDTGFDTFDFWKSYRSGAGQFELYDDLGVPSVPDTGLSNTETNGMFMHDFLDEQLASGEPFYVYDAFVAPHNQQAGGGRWALPTASPENANRPVPPFRYAPERFTGDKRPIFHTPLRRGRAFYQRLFTARARAMYDVDDQMASVFERLEAEGVLDETAVIFASDNGYTDRGQVNWLSKSIPYPAATDIPMLAYYPGGSAGVDRRQVSLVDIGPTFYDALDVTPQHVVDGHSLLGDHRRNVVFAEFKGEDNQLVRQESGLLSTKLRSWKMVKRDGMAYVEWYRANGAVLSREFYTDRAMTKNLLYAGHSKFRPPRPLLRRFAALLDRTAACKGTVEQGSPRPCP